ncbi:MAG TPA: T9SS type A sorting domain-containing protein [Flavobacteriaceae bacterium]
MKHLYTFLLYFITVFAVEAQIINIPDANFKNALVNTFCVDTNGDYTLDDDVDTNNDGEIQVAEAEAVTSLDISSKNISNLDGIENFINLFELDCSNNLLESLDLRSIPISILGCSSNPYLTSILLKNGVTTIFYPPPAPPGGSIFFNCPNLSFVCADEGEDLTGIQNHIEALGYTNCFVTTDCSLISIIDNQIINFPDPNFKNALLNQSYPQVDTNNDGEIQVSEARSITILSMSNKNISDMTGIEAFVNLESLSCSNNNFTTLNLSNNINLLRFYCTDNLITTLDFSQNSLITEVRCFNNQLEEIIFGSHLDLNLLWCNNNKMTNLDVSGFLSLNNLVCSENLLSSLKIKNISEPFKLRADGNPDLYCIEVSDPNNFRLGNNIYINPQVNFNVDCSADDDSDGVDNNNDLCVNTLIGETVDVNGCSDNQNADDDNDTVKNGIDRCPGTTMGEPVNQFGCPLSEIVSIPDVILKSELINSTCVDSDGDGITDNDADTNNDGDIQIDEALAVQRLIFSDSSYGPKTILDITGLDSFINLMKLDFNSIYFYNGGWNGEPAVNYVRSIIDFTSLIQLEYLRMYGVNTEDVNEIDLSGLSNLTYLDLSNVRDANEIESVFAFTDVNLEGCSSLQSLTYTNSFLNIDFCQIPSLTYLDCHYLEGGEPDIFDFSCLVNLDWLDINENSIKVLILKNSSTLSYLGINNELSDYLTIEYICIDDNIEEYNQVRALVEDYTVVNSYCSFEPGGEYYIAQGTSKVDSNSDGCDGSDPVFPNLKFNVTDGVINGDFISDSSGNYSIPLQVGIHTITPMLENPDYFTISPSSFMVDFSTDSSPYIQDFCISPISGLKDLEITIIPKQVARPGFDTDYKIVFKNKGSTTLSGSVDLSFNDDLMDFVSANPNVDIQNTGSLIWNYTDLLPFESRSINFTMNLNTPTDPSFPLNGGDILVYHTTINPVAGDETENDNAFTLNQNVVNSYDPNDKTCLEGDTITPDLVGEYVHYLIRFENTGTANAINIVVKDIIDTAKFDIETLFITDASHDLVTNITNTNEVEFVFENIDLPFDDANNDGYIGFKIKTLNSLIVGDAFDNDAEIYFDFNAPIVTNNYSTSIENSLGIQDFNKQNVKVYPNPVKDKLFLNSQENIKNVVIYDVNGRLLSQSTLIGDYTKKDIDVSHLAKGVYFLRLRSDIQAYTLKIIKE